MEVTLDALLRSRDERWAMEKRLLREYPKAVVVVLTVVMPGSVKRDWRSLVVANAAVEAVNELLGECALVSSTRDLETGFEGYWVVRGDAVDVKRRLCAIEETHPLGRLFDIDVLCGNAVPIPRTALGLAPRQCLLCANEARWCMRNRSHAPEEVQAKITEMAAAYRKHGVDTKMRMA